MRRDFTPLKKRKKPLVKSNKESAASNDVNRFAALQNLIDDEEEQAENSAEQTLDDNAILQAEAAATKTIGNNTDNTGRHKATSPLPQRPPNKARMIAEKQDSGTVTEPEMETDTVLPPPAKKQLRQTIRPVASGPAHPQIPTERAGGEQVVCGPGTRDTWEIDRLNPTMDTIVITDSNGRTWGSVRHQIPQNMGRLLVLQRETNGCRPSSACTHGCAELCV